MLARASHENNLISLRLKFYVMKGFKINIEKATAENDNFRKVLYIAPHSQLVLMSLKPKEEIGKEIHHDNDQFFRIEAGQGKCIIDDSEYELRDGDAIVILAGAKHNIINTSKTASLKMYTMYSPAHSRRHCKNKKAENLFVCHKFSAFQHNNPIVILFRLRLLPKLLFYYLKLLQNHLELYRAKLNFYLSGSSNFRLLKRLRSVRVFPTLQTCR